jgi:toxin ParE1/3/4
MPRFLLTRAAAADLEEIDRYIARDAPAAADRLLAALHEAMLRLADFPEIGHLRADLAEELLRFWPVSSYLIVYRTDLTPLQIVRILHASRDVRALLTE